MKIVVLGGGESNERDVSSASASASSAALRTLGHEVVEVDPAAWPEPARFTLKVPAAPPDPMVEAALAHRVRSNLVDP